MSRKMNIFQKSKHIKASTKNDHFSPNFTSHFLDPFSSSATQHWFRSHSHIATFNTLTMAPKTKKGANLKADTKPPASGAKRARKPSSKVAESAATLESSDEDVATSHPVKARRMMRISWTTARTERLLDWLEENPVDRQKLFSDSTKDAKDEGRRKRVAKGTKGEFHKLIAVYVFSVDADKGVRDDFAANSGNYSKSVDNYLGRYGFFYLPFSSLACLSASSRLRKDYRLFNEKLGQTGAGLKFEDVEEGSTLSNLIGLFLSLAVAYANCSFFLEQLEQEFPFWKRLHGFWRTLPNFNPYTASSEPGQDLAADALALIQGRGQENDTGNNDELGFEDDMYYTPVNCDADADEKVDSSMQSNEQVCR
jgi:hypothetical protein